MATREFRDEASFEKWLKSGPQRQMTGVARMLCSRLACRMLFAAIPHDMRWSPDTYEYSPLQFFRAAQASAVAARKNNGSLRRAAKLSSRMVWAAPRSSATVVVADSARVASLTSRLETFELSTNAVNETVKVFGPVVFDSLWSDVKILYARTDLFANPLWGDQCPVWIKELESEVRGQLKEKEPETWSFWFRWWDGVLSGKQLDWNLQEQVALIPDDIWQLGPEAVAKAILEIEKSPSPAFGEGTAAQRQDTSLRAVRLQVESLKLLVDSEWASVSARNDVPEAERSAHERHRDLLARLRDLIVELQSIADGNSDAATGTELVVVSNKLPAIAKAAEELAEATRQPEPSASIIAIAASTKVLTESGVPGHFATGIAISDLVMRSISGFLAKWRKK